VNIRSRCRTLMEIILPHGPCILCGGDSRGGPAPGLCAACWRSRRLPKQPLCRICGLPLPPVEGQETEVCGRCLADSPAYEAHASAFIYAGPVRALLLLYKDQRRYPLSRLLGKALARRVRRLWPEAAWDAVVYVPSPIRRRMARGFEPAGLIARAAAEHLGVPCRKWLHLRKSPRPQKGLSAAARKRNLQGAFTAEKGAPRGQRVLLIDDIRTTGATLRETARVLERAGASVHAATVAMVLPRELDLISGAVDQEPPRGPHQ
jgi:ComF family protein